MVGHEGGRGDGVGELHRMGGEEQVMHEGRGLDSATELLLL